MANTNKKTTKKRNDATPSNESRTKRLFSRIFQLKAWADWDRVKSGASFVVAQIKKYFVPNTAPRFKSSATSSDANLLREAFDKAQSAQKLSDADMVAREKSLRRLSQFMLGIAALVFIYFLYHLIFGSLAGAILTFAVVCIALAFSFRYHFWYFQIRERKLGCTFSEWYREGLRGGSK